MLYEKQYERVTLVGLCTDICVISNALNIKALLWEIPIIVDAKCCAGVIVSCLFVIIRIFKNVSSFNVKTNSESFTKSNFLYSSEKAFSKTEGIMDVLVPTMEVFHYDGRLLINTEGQSAFDTFHPIASADFFDKHLL